MSLAEHFAGYEQLVNFSELSGANFDDAIHSHNVVVIDFWADWCMPCRAFAKTFIEVAQEFSDVHFATVNIDHERALAEEFAIRSVPFVMIIREQVVVFAESGQMPKSALETLLQQALSLDMEEVKKNSLHELPPESE